MPRRYAMEARAAQAATTRRRLVDAAIAVLGDRGAEGLTMQAVADEADVSLRTVYNHFASREELLVDSMSALIADTRAGVEALPTGGTPQKRLARFVDAYVDSYERQGSASTMLLAVRGEPALDALVGEARSWRRQRLAAVLRPAARDGELRVPLGQATALAFLATSHATWTALVGDAGLAPAAARAALHHMVSASVFRTP